jgi:hypothetical protein
MGPWQRKEVAQLLPRLGYAGAILPLASLSNPESRCKSMQISCLMIGLYSSTKVLSLEAVFRGSQVF